MKKIAYILAIWALALGSTSCNDEFLERYPEGTTTEASAFTSYNSSMSYLLTLYNCFNGFTIYSGPIPVSGALGTSTRDIWSGILTNYGYGAGTVDNPYAAQNVSIPTSDGTYSSPYEFIRAANLMLKHIQDPVCSDSERLHLEAIARFFRAFNHYALMVNYGDIIYVDHLLDDTSPELYKARDSRLYVADQIYNELIWCINNIQDDLAEPNTVNSDVVKAFLTRFALFEGTWRKYHNVAEEGEYITGQKLLEECVRLSEELMSRYPTLYTGDASGGDTYPGKGWGQLWTTENLQGVPGVILYMKYTEDYKMHRLGHFEHIGSASLEMPQSTVDLYLTKDGLPIHNARVKYYDYNGADDSYTEGEPYDYANCDIYKTFRNRDPRLWQTVMPPYHVNTTSTGINDFTYDESNGYKYMEYLRKFPSRGNETNLTDNGKPVYRIPEVQTGYYLISGHKALPSGNWGGNLQPNVPNTSLSSSGAMNGALAAGLTPFNSSKTYQLCKSGYFVWKHHAGWDRQDQNVAKEISDKPLFKIEEVLLNYAEAKFELGAFNQTVADQSINLLRDRAEVSRMTVAEIGSDFDPDRDPSVDPVLWEIRRERLIELMGESFSFEDVRRWKKADWYVNKQHYGAYVENATTQGISSISLGETGILKQGGTTEASASELAAQGNAGHLYFYQDPTSAGKGWLRKCYLMPIPSGEILLNENLEQQELWK